MITLKSKTYDEERALYACKNVHLIDCNFSGPADGESALKESKNVIAEGCYFNLRYPFWHDTGVCLKDSELTELCRAAFWYTQDVQVINTKLHGIKAFRECDNVEIKNSSIISPEFGWSTRNIVMKDSSAESEYFFLRGENIKFDNVNFKGKYSFQYIKNAVFENCNFDTKDAFWHAENVTVKNSVVKGEYLAWYSKGLTLENCKIIGTQPLCYCENLKLINCEMVDTDLSFEKSEVEATLTAPIMSIKNPLSGTIYVPKADDVIFDEEWAKGEVIITG